MKKIINSERLLTITAMLVSLVTLLIFVYQTNLLRQQNYLSILPYLSVSSVYNEAEYSFEINVANQGVGPAIIESVEVYYAEKKYRLEAYEDRLYNVLLELAPQLDSVKFYSASTMEKGLAIPTNTTYNLVRIKNAPSDFRLLSLTFEELLEEGFSYRIVYKSIQNERWEIRTDSDGPDKLN